MYSLETNRMEVQAEALVLINTVRLNHNISSIKRKLHLINNEYRK